MLSFPVATLDTGERALFQRLYEENYNVLFHYAKSILGDDPLAEDAVQEAFVRVLKNLAKIDETDCSRTRSFLVTIVKNTAIDLYNTRKKAATLEIIDSDECSDPADIDDPTWNTFHLWESKKVLDSVLQELPEDYQTLLLYRVFYGWSYRELAGLLKISEKNVSVKLSRARKRLLQLYERERGESDD